MLEKTRLPEVLLPFVRDFAGGGDGNVETLAGDASARRYHRVRLDGATPGSAVVMELPDEPLKSEEATAPGAGPPELPFLNVHRYLDRGGYPVPQVFRVDLGRGLVALEDLGDRTFESVVSVASPGDRRRHYETAIAKIVQLQDLGRRHADESCLAFTRRFDQTLLRWELDHFKVWYLEAERGVHLVGAEAVAVESAFDWLAGELAAAPATLVHRDFQSRNLMVIGSNDPPEVKVIDFQDALLGPVAYDLVALLRDSYVALNKEEVDGLVDHFVQLAGLGDGVAFKRLFVLQTLQRKLKDVGRFVFIDRVRKNPSFLRWIPTTLGYLRDGLAAAPDELRPLAQILGRRVPDLQR